MWLIIPLPNFNECPPFPPPPQPPSGGVGNTAHSICLDFGFGCHYGTPNVVMIPGNMNLQCMISYCPEGVQLNQLWVLLHLTCVSVLKMVNWVLRQVLCGYHFHLQIICQLLLPLIYGFGRGGGYLNQVLRGRRMY